MPTPCQLILNLRKVFHSSFQVFLWEHLAIFPTCAFFLMGICLFPNVTPSFGQTSDFDQPIVTDTHIVTPHDRIPRLCVNPTATAQNSGAWSDPGTWSSGKVPDSEARVLIPENVRVRYDQNNDTDIDCIEIDGNGELHWATDQHTRLRVTNLQVLPNGKLTIGTSTNPVPANFNAELIFRDVPLDVSGRDPSQYGNGLAVFGSVTIHGHPMERGYLRLSKEVRSGDTTLELENAPIGWNPDDRVVIPDTRQIPFRKKHTFTSQAEESTIQSITGSTISLTSPLQFDHIGPRDGDGNVGPVELSMLPHVGNLSRNVVIRSTRFSEVAKATYCQGSQNITSPSTCVTRGHVIFLRRAFVDIRYAAFENLGRTTNDSLDNTTLDSGGNPTHTGSNQIGRYSLHMHHVMGPVNPGDSGFQYHLIGNVIQGMLKWGLTIHDSHYGLIQDNIAYDGQGAAITTEDGNESFNVFERNFVVHTKAGDQERILESPKRGGVFNNRRLFGTTRDGFWFSGMNNYVRDNVVANAPDFAYNYNGYYLTPDQPIPNFRGANMETDSTIHTALPVLESARNEAYGATGQGLWATWSRGCCNVGRYLQVSLFQDYRIWHMNHSGAEFYHDNRNTLDGFILRNDVGVTAQSQGGSLRFNRGFNFSNKSYENGQTIFRNIDMQGFNVGILLPLRPEDKTEEPNLTILENSFLKNYVNIQEGLPNIDLKETIIRNVRVETLNIPAISGQPAQPTSIHMRYALSRHTNLVNRTSQTRVIDFNGVLGQNFEVYFEEQAPNYPTPPPPDFNGRLKGCPEPNLTNQQCMANHGVSVAGVVAPCLERDGDASCSAAKARAESLGIKGLVFLTNESDNNPPPQPPSNIRIVNSDLSGTGTLTLTWDPNPENDIGGYRLYRRTSSGTFGAGLDLGKVTETVVTNLQSGVTYFFAVTAYNNNGHESDLSNEISPPNSVPTANDDTMTTSGLPNLIIDLAENDEDSEGGIDRASIAIVNGPQHGTVTVNADGTVTYSPAGTDTFTYTIRDAHGEVSNVATVTIQFQSPAVVP